MKAERPLKDAIEVMSEKAERPLKDAIQATFVKVPRIKWSRSDHGWPAVLAAPKKLYERRRGGGPRGDEREGCENARSSVEAERPFTTSAEAAKVPDRPEDEATEFDPWTRTIETPWRRSRRLRKRPINPRTRRDPWTRFD